MTSFGDLLGNIFSSSHKGSVVGIDIGSSAIKIVEIEKIDDRATLKNYGEIILGPRAGVSAGQATNLPSDKIAEALRDLLTEAGVIPKHTLFAIPFSASLLSVVELPDVGSKELESMIPLEARRYIPMPLAEVSLDWWILPKRKVSEKTNMAVSKEAPTISKIEVILAAIRNDVLTRFSEIKSIAKIPNDATHFEIELFSTLRGVVGRDLSPIVVIDIGAGSTKLAFVDEGVVRGSHMVAVGGQDVTLALAKSLGVSITQAEEMKCRAGMIGDYEGRDVATVAGLIVANIINETSRFIENYERRYGIKIAKIILVGGGARLKGIEKSIAVRFPQVSVMVGDPFSRLAVPAFLTPTLKELSPTFAVAVGIALKGLEE